jgi:hypothetical protein
VTVPEANSAGPRCDHSNGDETEKKNAFVPRSRGMTLYRVGSHRAIPLAGGSAMVTELHLGI